ncbi:hypothetical protein STENM223S_03548 [Streptomyces tendae]
MTGVHRPGTAGPASGPPGRDASAAGHLPGRPERPSGTVPRRPARPSSAPVPASTAVPGAARAVHRPVPAGEKRRARDGARCRGSRA